MSHWTARELAIEMVKREMVKSISPRHVRLLLEEAQLKPHQIRFQHFSQETTQAC